MATEAIEIVTRMFGNDGRTPNSETLPLVLMRVTVAMQARNTAVWFETTFRKHGWGGMWRWGVYPFHHFHSNTHEVLGVSRGDANLMLGGEAGELFHVTKGDVIIIPAGVGHQCVSSSSGFEVVGAYPGDYSPDLLRSGEADLKLAAVEIANVPVPDSDPVFGSKGPLRRLWGGGES